MIKKGYKIKKSPIFNSIKNKKINKNLKKFKKSSKNIIGFIIYFDIFSKVNFYRGNFFKFI